MGGGALCLAPPARTLVIGHLLPLSRAPEQMCLPLLFQQDL